MRWLALLVLAGCGFTGQGWYDANVRDLDGDGEISERFGGPDCRDDDPSITVCDADGDGVRSQRAGGDDCDDEDASVAPGAEERCNQRDDDCDGLIDNDDPDVVGGGALFRDGDGDGAGNPERPEACQEYDVPGDPSSGRFVSNDDDCDDTDPAVNPDAVERCDGFDNDCDGAVDDVGLWFVDADGDGYGVTGTQATGACDLSATDGLAAVDGDCDDTDADVSPGSDEVPYDGVDANCNGGLDDWDVDFDGHVPDEHFAAAEAANQALPPAERWDLAPGDCDDTNPARFSGNPEVCDGVDNDCDAAVDAEDLDQAGPTDEVLLRSQVTEVYADVDADGHFGTAVLLCPASIDPHLYASVVDDCYDGGVVPAGFEGADPASIHAGAEEVCDGFDNDCDGRVDHSTTDGPALSPHFFDNDGDGYGAAPVFACGEDPALGIVATSEDCNDAAPTVYPGAPELCGDAVRQDCSTASVFDCDSDGFEGSYVGGGTGEDCDDELAVVFPTSAAGAEICDGIDNDCDGHVDSADTDNLDTGEQPFWYVDNDGDGFGDPATGVQQCDQPAGAVLDGTDCADDDAEASPATVWTLDADGDGFGADATAVASCVQPSPDHVTVGGDCNDADATVNPAVLWYRDEDGDQVGNPTLVDTFCVPPAGEGWVPATNGVDCDDSDPDLLASLTWFRDLDGDGAGDPAIELESCVQPVVDGVTYVSSANDCDDLDAGRHPSRDEICNGIDDDCDLLVDDQDPTLAGTVGGPIGYPDADGDGFGADVPKAFCFALAPGFVSVAGDCDDTEPLAYPGAAEICANGIDDDCDGEEQIPSWYQDDDEDGFGTGPVVVEDCEPPQPTGFASVDGDCDDTLDSTYPGAVELDACDAIDSDCDGTPEPRLTWYFDEDGDGFGDDATALTACSPPTAPPQPGLTGEWLLQGGDCEADDPSVTFGRLWYVDSDGDGLGNDTAAFFDCPVFGDVGEQLTSFLLEDLDEDGTYDPGDVAASIFSGDCDDDNALVGLARSYSVDADGDGWGTIHLAEVIACPSPVGGPPAGLVTRGGDCVDVAADDPDTSVAPELINPEQIEVLDDLADNDCDGFTDQIGGGILWYEDQDGDGLGGTPLASYQPGAVTNGTDCDDADATVANGLFQYTDADQDGFGAGTASFTPGVCVVLEGNSRFAGDCDDSDAAVVPGATESCNGLDDDCDGLVDEGVTVSGFRDLDGDGTGDPNQPVDYCPGTAGSVSLDNTDCNDLDASVNTLAPELCDGVDTNCDGLFGGEEDLDGDGYRLCDDDCDDTQAQRHPGAAELCDGVADNDCDALTPDPEDTDEDEDGFVLCFDPDDSDPNTPANGVLWYRDADDDGHGNPNGPTVSATQQPEGFVLVSDDCDDTDPDVHPEAPERCNGLDDDCDGLSASGSPDVWFVPSGALIEAGLSYYGADLDRDGLFEADSLFASCTSLPAGLLEQGDLDFDFQRANAVETVAAWTDCLALGGAGTLMLHDSDGDGRGALNERLPFLGDCGVDPPADFVAFDGIEDCAPTDPVRSYFAGPDDFVDADGDGFFSALTAPGSCVASVSVSPGSDCHDGAISVSPTIAPEPLPVADQAALDAALSTCTQATLLLSGTGLQVFAADLLDAGDLVVDGAACGPSCLTLIHAGAPISPGSLELRDVEVSGDMLTAGGIVLIDGVTWTGGVLDVAGGSITASDTFFDGVQIHVSAGSLELEYATVSGGSLSGTAGQLYTFDSVVRAPFDLALPMVDGGSLFQIETAGTKLFNGIADLHDTTFEIDLGSTVAIGGTFTCEGCDLIGPGSVHDDFIVNPSGSATFVDVLASETSFGSEGALSFVGGAWSGTSEFVRARTSTASTIVDGMTVVGGSSGLFDLDGSELLVRDSTIEGGGPLLQTVDAEVLFDRVEISVTSQLASVTGGEVTVRDSTLDLAGTGFEVGPSPSQLRLDGTRIDGGSLSPILSTSGTGHTIEVVDCVSDYQGQILATSGGTSYIEVVDTVVRDAFSNEPHFSVGSGDLLFVRDSSILRPNTGLVGTPVFSGGGFAHLAQSVVWVESDDIQVLAGLEGAVLDRTTVVAVPGFATSGDGLIVPSATGDLTLIESAIEVIGGAAGMAGVDCPNGGLVFAQDLWITDAAMVNGGCAGSVTGLVDASSTGPFDASSAAFRSFNPAVFGSYGHTAF